MDQQGNLVLEKLRYSQDQTILIQDMYRRINDIVYTVNFKKNGIYSLNEFYTAGHWYPDQTSNIAKPIINKVIDCGALPNIATKNVAHNLNPTGTITADWNIIRRNGEAKDPAAIQWISIFDPRITITIDNTNLIITTTANLSAFTETKVILWYTQP